MSRRLALLVLLGALLSTGCNRVQVEPAARAAGPSVLLVTIDTLRADHVGAYGDAEAETPNLDGLAARGGLFETAISPAPLTLPAHTSLLTGLYPPAHGVRHNGMFRLAEGTPTLASVFHRAGYRTAAVVGAAVLDRHYGLARGFDHYGDRAWSGSASKGGFRERRAQEVTDEALAWLASGAGPFFLWVHYYDPHAAYRPPPPFARRFAERPYDGEIAYVDQELGRLLAGLDATGGRTLVVVVADHGESLGEHGEATHAYGLYDATLRVPWILAGPGIPPGRRVEGVVSSIDLAPTLLSLSGLPPLSHAQGRDRSPWLTGEAEAPPVEPVYAETLATRLDHGWAPLFAMRSPTHLYIRAPRPELYDVVRDPAERRELLHRSARRTLEVVARLEPAIERIHAESVSLQPLSVDHATREQLGALGYQLSDAPVPETGLDPKDGLRLLGRFEAAERDYREDRLSTAEAEARALLSALPESPRLHNLLARIYLERRDLERCLRHARIAARLAPESARHREMLATARRESGDLEGALADYRAALARDPDLPEAHIGLMWELERGGSLADADAQAQAALAVDPESVVLHLWVADAWSRLGRYQRALAAYRQALVLDPRSKLAQRGIALQLVRIGDLAEADRHLALAGAAARAPASQLQIAIAFAVRGEAARARALLLDLRRRYPDFDAPLRVLQRLDGQARPG